jgi:hypothetical protein
VSELHEKSVIADLRDWYLGRLNKTAKWFIAHLDTKEISRPTTLQEIPPLAKEMLEFIRYPEPTDTYTTIKGELKTYEEANPAKELVQMSLELAKELGLLRSGMDLPLRRIWYSFIKAALERGLKGYVYTEASTLAGEQREASDSDYYDGFSDIIKGSSDLWYNVYGIKNTGKMTFVPREGMNGVLLGDMFSPIMIGIEKTSYFEVLKNMCSMLGMALYAAGGQSSVSASEEIMKRIDPEMKNKDQKHLDIYAITDFDPAGYSIAKGIFNHSKLFIERYGGNVDFERLAPLPKHYTDTELEQGLYTVKKKWSKPTIKTFKRGKRKGESETKGHWGYNPIDRTKPLPDNIKLGAIEVLEEREANDFYDFKKDSAGRYIQGLEIESLPEEPIEEILENPPSKMPRTFTGIARMRFIIFDDIIKRHGLDTAYKFLIGLKNYRWGTYSGEVLVENVINVKNAEKVDKVVSDADRPFWVLHTNLEEWIQSYIEDEKNEVIKDIDGWLDDVIEQYTNPEHEDYNKEITDEFKEQLKDKIYRALADNSSSISFDFPEEFKIEKVEGYDEEFEITIPDKIIDNIRPIADFAKCIALNAQQVVDYLKDLKGELGKNEHIFDRAWEIPTVQACKINEEGEAEFVKTEIIETNCSEYKSQIRRLNDEIAEYESDIIKLEKQIKEAPEEASDELQANLKELRRLAEMRQKEVSDWEDKYVKLNTQYRVLQDVIDKKNKEIQELKGLEVKIERLNKLLEECNNEKEKLQEKIGEGLLPKEAEKILLELEKLRQETTKEIAELRKEIEAKRVSKAPKVEIKKEVEKIKKSVAEKFEEMKEVGYKKETSKMKDMLSLLNEEITGTDYFGKWNEKPMSWDEMRIAVPMEMFTESKLIRDLGEGNLARGKKIWNELSEKEKSELVNKNLVGFTSLKEQIETEKELKLEIRKHLHDVLGGDVPMLTEGDESYEDTLERVPFKYWYEKPDVEDPKIFNKRIQIYQSHTQNAAQTTKRLIGEKIDAMTKLYKTSYPKIEKATGQDKFNQLSLLSGDLNKLNADIKKLYYYGR